MPMIEASPVKSLIARRLDVALKLDAHAWLLACSHVERLVLEATFARWACYQWPPNAAVLAMQAPVSEPFEDV